MAIRLRRNPAPLAGALFVSNPKRRKKKNSTKKGQRRKTARAAYKGTAQAKAKAARLRKARAAAARKRRLKVRRNKRPGMAAVRRRKAATQRKPGTRTGMRRKTARRAYMKTNRRGRRIAAKRRGRRINRRGTRKGMVRRTARRAYMRKNPLELKLLKPVQKMLKKVPVVGQVAPLLGPAVFGMAGGAGIHYGIQLLGKVPVLGNVVNHQFGYALSGLIVASAIQFIPGGILSKELKKNLGIAISAAGGAINAYQLLTRSPVMVEEEIAGLLHGIHIGDEDDDLSGLALQSNPGDLPFGQQYVHPKKGPLPFGQQFVPQHHGLPQGEQFVKPQPGQWAYGDGMAYEIEPLDYSGADLGDAYYSGEDLSVSEGHAAVKGPSAWLAQGGRPPHHAAGPRRRHSSLAGRRFHRWGWLIKMLGFKRFQQLAALPAQQRVALIAKLRDSAMQAVKSKFDNLMANPPAAATGRLAMDMSGLAIDPMAGLAITGAGI